MSAAWELQKAVYQVLIADGPLNTLLGAPNVFDDVPRDSVFPYVTFGQSLERDWSTATEDGNEHIVTMHVWSRENGRREVFEVMKAVRDALHDQALALTGYALINLRHEFSDARREPDGETYHGIVRYRATTEPVL